MVVVLLSYAYVVNIYLWPHNDYLSKFQTKLISNWVLVESLTGLYSFDSTSFNLSLLLANWFWINIKSKINIRLIISVKLKKIITKFWIKENVRTLFSYNLTLNGLYATKFSSHCWWWFNDNIQTKIPQIIWSVWIGTQSICLYFNFLYAFSLIYSKKPKREFQLHIQHPSTCCLGRSKYLQKYYANN